MMCTYCGSLINGDAIELVYNDRTIQLCEEECAIYYYQEQQQRHFQTWVKIR